MSLKFNIPIVIGLSLFNPIDIVLFAISRFIDIKAFVVVSSAYVKLISLTKFMNLPEFKNQINFNMVVLLDPFLPVNKFKSG
ncbi:hypothetical protein SDC9_167252 [bioreactor metagenome]|uniref:Uncharacterized protein n=1 Tax=bioreactor metagenome TaxID=1076179 RepID=A0A645FZA2_9ZZZZ